jgi:hypothetical protein
VSGRDRAPLRVALLHHDPPAACVAALADALRTAGHGVAVVGPRPVPPA